MTGPDASRTALRRTLRRQRRQLPRLERARRQQQLLRHLQRDLPWRRWRHVGAYLAGDGEADPLPWVLRPGRPVWLPVLHYLQRGHMDLSPWHPGQPLRPNRYRIPEPRRGGRHEGGVRAVWALDLLLVPLVAFDADGYRLGMGGGFYDRLLERFDRHPRRPLCVGVAFRFQQVERVPRSPWDRPLDQVITD